MDVDVVEVVVCQCELYVSCMCYVVDAVEVAVCQLYVLRC